jgi:hypothetical protein
MPEFGTRRGAVRVRQGGFQPRRGRRGVEDTFAPELTRMTKSASARPLPRMQVGETVIHFADDAWITPGEARKLAGALVELADCARRPAMTVGETLIAGTVLLSARPRPHRSWRGPPQSAAREHPRQPAEG